MADFELPIELQQSIVACSDCKRHASMGFCVAHANDVNRAFKRIADRTPCITGQPDACSINETMLGYFETNARPRCVACGRAIDQKGTFVVTMRGFGSGERRIAFFCESGHGVAR